ncbi:hypothetical protein VTL71DRAFT_11800 [Oculimacula yallundae]|uniref:methylated diphthine methylhydrolase n=1 Tax=Oculimacula yallundae TaxID=86028 RepID=A0ABR4CRR4_9HELO
MSNAAANMSVPNYAVVPMAELDLQKPPTCIQFVPALEYPNYLVVGTYLLEPNQDVKMTDEFPKDSPMEEKPDMLRQQSRSGSLFLIEYAYSQLRIVHEIECPSAVYHLQFLQGDSTIFVAASSTGTISFYHVGEMHLTPAPQMKLLWASQVFSADTIITYFEIISDEPSPLGSLITATTDTGGVYLMNYSLESRSVELLNDGMPITQHWVPWLDHEPDNVWCCASIDRGDQLKILSGSDSTILKCASITKHGNSPVEPHRAVNEVHKFHDAGVTAILPLPIQLGSSDLILTGSYDEYIRLYSLQEKSVLAELKLGGGVYRLKLVRQYLMKKVSYIILASCMHAGTKVLEVGMDLASETYTMKVIASLGVQAEHYSYAADFQPLDVPEDHDYKQLCVSGNYVDRKIRVWEYDAEAEDRR